MIEHVDCKHPVNPFGRPLFFEVHCTTYICENIQAVILLLKLFASVPNGRLKGQVCHQKIHSVISRSFRNRTDGLLSALFTSGDDDDLPTHLGHPCGDGPSDSRCPSSNQKHFVQYIRGCFVHLSRPPSVLRPVQGLRPAQWSVRSNIVRASNRETPPQHHPGLLRVPPEWCLQEN